VAVCRNWRHWRDGLGGRGGGGGATGLEVGVAALIPSVPPSSTQIGFEGAVIGTTGVIGLL
jgi:hypothetical protein